MTRRQRGQRRGSSELRRQLPGDVVNSGRPPHELLSLVDRRPRRRNLDRAYAVVRLDSPAGATQQEEPASDPAGLFSCVPLVSSVIAYALLQTFKIANMPSEPSIVSFNPQIVVLANMPPKSSRWGSKKDEGVMALGKERRVILVNWLLNR
ncbi:uncharacterized protein A4U43_C08F18280 [Asparagus officinalis]|nr:uncharacterized protein A4U43_C08F18280 [Asparagus officinalis]